MGEGKSAGIEIDEQGLDIAQHAVAAGGVTDVTHGHVAFEAVDDLARSEMIADEAEAALGVEVGAVETDDARGFLPPMLERMQTKRGQRGGVGMIEDAEDAALLVQPVLIEPAQRLIVGVVGFGHLVLASLK